MNRQSSSALRILTLKIHHSLRQQSLSVVTGNTVVCLDTTLMAPLVGHDKVDRPSELQSNATRLSSSVCKRDATLNARRWASAFWRHTGGPSTGNRPHAAAQARHWRALQELLYASFTGRRADRFSLIHRTGRTRRFRGKSLHGMVVRTGSGDGPIENRGGVEQTNEFFCTGQKGDF